MREPLKLKVGDKFRVSASVALHSTLKPVCIGHWLTIVEIRLIDFQFFAREPRYVVEWRAEDNFGKEMPLHPHKHHANKYYAPKDFYWIDKDWDLFASATLKKTYTKALPLV